MNSAIRCRIRSGATNMLSVPRRLKLSPSASSAALQQQQCCFFSSSTPSSLAHDTKPGTGSVSAAGNNKSFQRAPVVPYPWSASRTVPDHIIKPPYAATGAVPHNPRLMETALIHHDAADIHRMRQAARLARRVLDLACNMAQPGVTTDEIDAAVHAALIQANAYPSPLNYAGFPKSLCSSVNEVICHGIPDLRPLCEGDVVSFDVSCFLQGVHGDNCATVIVGDDGRRQSSSSKHEEEPRLGYDWRGVPYRTDFGGDSAMEAHFVEARRLVQATRESLYAAIDTCRDGSCLTEIGAAIHDVADAYGFGTVEKYRGHGICHEFHCFPFVKHYRNHDRIPLKTGMIFTIEPMLTQKSAECFEWDDEWTVSTLDGALSAQFEHTILITDSGAEILTLSDDEVS